MPKAYIFQAALYCEHCGDGIKADLTAAGRVPATPDDEGSYDSDYFPKGPFPEGGGEADTPNHCDNCGLFLENPLTPDGGEYVRKKAKPFETEPDMTWSEIAAKAEEANQMALGEWIRFYLAWGQ
jgi:hypothetical protein